jgi:hypothetical protein
MGDYMIINDFYSQLRNRNLYLLKSKEKAVDQSKISKLNETCLEAAEKALKDIDWNKY